MAFSGQEDEDDDDDDDNYNFYTIKAKKNEMGSDIEEEAEEGIHELK